VSQWASTSNLQLNSSKSCDMLVHLPTNKHLNLPTLVPNLTRVDQINTLSCGRRRVNLITVKAAASFHALKMLKSHGLSGPALWDVARDTLLAQITYASPSWRGFINADEANKLQTILSNAKRSNFKPIKPSDFSALEELFDSSRFCFVPCSFNNSRACPTPTPPCWQENRLQSSFLRIKFLVRMLYRDVCWHFSVLTLLFHVPSLRLSMTFHKETDDDDNDDNDDDKTVIGTRDFAVSAAAIWNSLPAALRLSSCSVQTFARKLKTFYSSATM